MGDDPPVIEKAVEESAGEAAEDDGPAPGTPAYMCEVLLHLESQMNTEGWDRPPQLYALAGTGDEASGWILEALMADPSFWAHDRHPRLVLGSYAAFLAGVWVPPGAGDSRDFVLDGLVKQGLRAIVFAYEGWQLVGSGHDKMQSPTGMLADHPESKECRAITAILPDSTVVGVERIRGRAPVTMWLNQRTGDVGGTKIADMDGGGVDKVGGAIANAMRVIVNAVNERAGVPPIDYVTTSKADQVFLDQVLGRKA